MYNRMQPVSQTLALCCHEEHRGLRKGGSPYPDPSEWSWLRKTWVLGAGRKGPGCFSCYTRVQSPGTNRDFTDEAPSWHHDMAIMSQLCYPEVNNAYRFIHSTTYKSITRFTKFKNDSVCFEGSRVECLQSFWLYRANRLNASNTGLDS